MWGSAEARRRGAERLTILADPNATGFYERDGAVRIGEAPSDAALPCGSTIKVPIRRNSASCSGCGGPLRRVLISRSVT